MWWIIIIDPRWSENINQSHLDIWPCLKAHECAAVHSLKTFDIDEPPKIGKYTYLYICIYSMYYLSLLHSCQVLWLKITDPVWCVWCLLVCRFLVIWLEKKGNAPADTLQYRLGYASIGNWYVKSWSPYNIVWIMMDTYFTHDECTHLSPEVYILQETMHSYTSPQVWRAWWFKCQQLYWSISASRPFHAISCPTFVSLFRHESVTLIC